MKKEEREAADPMGRVKKAYKGHFLLNNLLDVAIEKIKEDGKQLEKEAVEFTPSSGYVRKR